MIIFANLLQAVGVVLGMLLDMMVFIIIGRAIVSWVNPDPYNPIVRFLTASTEPILLPLRRFIPPLGGRIDMTPIVLLFLVYFVKIALVQTLIDYATMLRSSGLSITTL